MRTHIDIMVIDILRHMRMRSPEFESALRFGPRSFGTKAAIEYMKRCGELLFYERAGHCAKPVVVDGMLWQRLDHCDGFRAICDIPSPEGLLL